jgi:predicted O-methyltransferase YrrM
MISRDEFWTKSTEIMEVYNSRTFKGLNEEWTGLVFLGDSYYRWLWAAVKVLQPKILVEIGRERGVSALIMLDAMSEDATLTSIDIIKESVFLENREEPRLTLITGNSLSVSDQVSNNIDFLFIDGLHEGDHVTKEWELYRPKLAEKAVVIFDDIHFNSGMSKFWENLQEDKHDISQWHRKGFGVVFIGYE